MVQPEDDSNFYGVSVVTLDVDDDGSAAPSLPVSYERPDNNWRDQAATRNFDIDELGDFGAAFVDSFDL